jgi:hypothetical protein
MQDERSEPMDELQARRFQATGPGSEDQAGHRERIRQLHLGSLCLDPGAAERAQIREKVVDYADGFMDRLDDGPAFVASQGEGSVLYDSPISEEPMGADEVLELLDFGVHQNGVNVGSAGAMAYIPGSNLYSSALADYLGAVTNRYSG